MPRCKVCRFAYLETAYEVETGICNSCSESIERGLRKKKSIGGIHHRWKPPKTKYLDRGRIKVIKKDD